MVFHMQISILQCWTSILTHQFMYCSLDQGLSQNFETVHPNQNNLSKIWLSNNPSAPTMGHCVQICAAVAFALSLWMSFKFMEHLQQLFLQYHIC